MSNLLADDILLAEAVANFVRYFKGTELNESPATSTATYATGKTQHGVAVFHDRNSIDVRVRLILKYEESLNIPKLLETLRRRLRQSISAGRKHLPLRRIDLVVDDLDCR